MKTRFYRTRKDGSECVISCTTRRANKSISFYGKFTFWPTKAAYQRGDCEGAVTYNAIYLGKVEEVVSLWASNVADRIVRDMDFGG